MTILTKSELRKAYEQKETLVAKLSAGDVELEPPLPSVMFSIFKRMGIEFNLDKANVEIEDGEAKVDPTKVVDMDQLMDNYPELEMYNACAITKNPRILPIDKPSDNSTVIHWGDLDTYDKLALIAASNLPELKVVGAHSFPADEPGDGENSVD